MRKIKINKIRYHNFKGLKDFELNLSGSNAKISAQNAKGKSSLFDGFLWLLFGKNSNESTKFNVKPLDEAGNEILGLEPCVEAEIVVDGTIKTLKCELKEVWQKPSGQLEKVRKSDTTKYYVDSVPHKLKEYQAVISDLIDEDTFKLLTNPAAFNNLHWQKQRDVLVSIAGDITDADVISKNESLKELTKILDGRSVEDQKKIIHSRKKEVKQDIDSFPARIDEAHRAKPDVSELNQKHIEQDIDMRNKQLNQLNEEISIIKNGGLAGKLLKQRNEKDAELQQIKNNFSHGLYVTTQSLQEDIRKVKDIVMKKEYEITESENKIRRLNYQIERDSSEKAEALSRYHEVYAMEFDEHRSTCPTCKQDLPLVEVDNLRENFNQGKSEELSAWVKKGTALKNNIEATHKLIEEETQHLADLNANIEDDRKKLSVLEKEYQDKTERAGSAESTAEYQKVLSDIQDITTKMAESDMSKQESLREIQGQIDVVEMEKETFKFQLQMFSTAEVQDKRITELKQEEKELKATYMQLEKQAFLIDEFVREKVRTLEVNINNKFQIVSFKLFNLQKNGALDETCEAIVNGVPYGDLNNAMKVNAGLDIINTLSNFYAVDAPIFVDNAESVNELQQTEAQMISLIVSKDKNLKVEVI